MLSGDITYRIKNKTKDKTKTKRRETKRYSLSPQIRVANFMLPKDNAIKEKTREKNSKHISNKNYILKKRENEKR